jgi:hypothetical protein
MQDHMRRLRWFTLSPLHYDRDVTSTSHRQLRSITHGLRRAVVVLLGPICPILQLRRNNSARPRKCLRAAIDSVTIFRMLRCTFVLSLSVMTGILALQAKAQMSHQQTQVSLQLRSFGRNVRSLDRLWPFCPLPGDSIQVTQQKVTEPAPRPQGLRPACLSCCGGLGYRYQGMLMTMMR